jgi:hypothetical protein
VESSFYQQKGPVAHRPFCARTTAASVAGTRSHGLSGAARGAAGGHLFNEPGSLGFTLRKLEAEPDTAMSPTPPGSFSGMLTRCGQPMLEGSLVLHLTHRAAP